MTPPARRRFFVADTGLLWNFSVIDRIDVLRDLVSGTGQAPRWTEQIHSEVCLHLPQKEGDFLSVFGEPICPEEDEQGLIFTIRDLYFRGPDDLAHQHLGEAQTIAICSSRYETDLVMMLTEDKSVRDFCSATQTVGSRHRELVKPQVWHGLVTRALLAAAVSKKYITETQQGEYIDQLLEAGRPLIPPAAKITWPNDTATGTTGVVLAPPVQGLTAVRANPLDLNQEPSQAPA